MESQGTGSRLRKDCRLAAPTCAREHLKTTFQKAAAVCALGLLTASAAIAQSHRILFLAGPRDHGAPGRHEYERDLRTLAQSFEDSSNLPGVTTQVIVGKAPRDL